MMIQIIACTAILAWKMTIAVTSDLHPQLGLRQSASSVNPPPPPVARPVPPPSVTKPTSAPVKKPTPVSQAPQQLPVLGIKPTPVPQAAPTRIPTSKPSLKKPTQLPSSSPTISASCPTGQVQAMTFDRVNKIIVDVASYICTEGGGSLSLKSNPPICTNASPQGLGPVIGGTLRLSFHDSVTYNGKTTKAIAGPDGCVDFTDPDNGGLKSVWFDKVSNTTPLTLNQIYIKYQSIISQGDFIALAANVAVLMAQGPDIYQRTGSTCSCIGSACIASNADTTHPCVNFRWGRKDSTNCNATDAGRFPSKLLAHQHIIDVFHDRLEFSYMEIVALMGAHTVGKATLAESQIGFTDAEVHGRNVIGAWSNTPHIFDIDYFTSINGVAWDIALRSEYADGSPFSPSTFMWMNGPPAGSLTNANKLMLNTDMALVFNVSQTVLTGIRAPFVVCSGSSVSKLGGNGGGGPPPQTCPPSPFNPSVSTIVNAGSTQAGTQVFFSYWVSAWQKMQELGWANGVKGTINSVGTSPCV